MLLFPSIPQPLTSATPTSTISFPRSQLTNPTTSPPLPPPLTHRSQPTTPNLLLYGPTQPHLLYEPTNLLYEPADILFSMTILNTNHRPHLLSFSPANSPTNSFISS